MAAKMGHSKLVLPAVLLATLCAASEHTLVYEGKTGAGRGKHVVLVSGDEEYRSEEAMPQLAKILATHHGFKCTVLFAIDPTDGTVNPNRQDNIPGLEALAGADLMVLFTRFRNLPDEQMKHIVSYVESGKPIVAMRTATHAFQIKDSPTWQRWSWNSKEWDGGFGRQVLGETWINHHGQHGKQSTRGVIAPGKEKHPILRGIREGSIWGPTDVYGVKGPLPADAEVLVLGQVLTGMTPTDQPVEGKQNDPMMPVAWTRAWKTPSGKTSRIFTTTMGSSQDLVSEGFRRLLVNAVYWALRMEGRIKPDLPIDLVGEYHPHPFGFNKYTKGRKPAEFDRP